MGYLTQAPTRELLVCEGEEITRRGRDGPTRSTLTKMLNYAVIFLIIAILAGVLGFGVVAGTAATIAKICFVVFLVLFLFSLLSGRKRL
jgi:uncharacterized membrane protein YtjA (UPF0391 family)